jgi:hypothetical protein
MMFVPTPEGTSLSIYNLNVHKKIIIPFGWIAGAAR